jgi:hypothetical protein
MPAFEPFSKNRCSPECLNVFITVNSVYRSYTLCKIYFRKGYNLRLFHSRGLYRGIRRTSIFGLRVWHLWHLRQSLAFPTLLFLDGVYIDDGTSALVFRPVAAPRANELLGRRQLLR